MKKILLGLLLLLLSMSVASAFTDSEYIIVVPEEGLAFNVVEGANFAAWITQERPVPEFYPTLKGGVTFTSATDAQVYEALSVEDVAEKVLLVIDSEREVVLLLVGEFASADALSVSGSAGHYFAQKGYAVFSAIVGQPHTGSVNVWDAEVGDRTKTIDSSTLTRDQQVFTAGELATIKDVFLGVQAPVKEVKGLHAEGVVHRDIAARSAPVEEPVVEGEKEDEPVQTKEPVPEPVVIKEETVEAPPAPTREPPAEPEGFIAKVLSWFRELF